MCYAVDVEVGSGASRLESTYSMQAESLVCGQFGLGLMRWMNRHTVTHVHYPVGRKQFFALITTQICGAMSLCNWCVAVWSVAYKAEVSDGFRRLVRATLTMVLMVSVTIVFSFLHRTPSFKPLKMLMTITRWYVGAQCTYEIWEFAQSFAEYTS